MKKFSKLKIIGDITCDVDGSIPTTIKSTTIEEPNFFLNTEIFSETEKSDGNLAIMAVDNLPSELPRDSSTEFGNGIVNEVIPYILEKDDGRILNSTITAEGRFLKKYNYLKSIADTDIFVNPLPSPVNIPVVVTLPASTLPETFNEVNVPVEVMFGCAAVSTVPDVSAYVAFATVPLTLAPATAFAVAANVTSPLTLAPATEFATPANPT